MTDRTAAIWRELLRRERFGRLLGSQCFVDGFNAALMAALDGDNYYPTSSNQGRCDPRRCTLYFDPHKCQRTAPLYLEGYEEGQASARRWLDDLAARRWNGRYCQVCETPLTGRQQKFCSGRCRVAAHRNGGSRASVTAETVTRGG